MKVIMLSLYNAYNFNIWLKIWEPKFQTCFASIFKSLINFKIFFFLSGAGGDGYIDSCNLNYGNLDDRDLNFRVGR